ncbi:response regulator [Psychrobacillus sp. FSL H8-0510]|uniref:response regulator n=1 Tax=Psychrobacillus sp. FSL H8-0510 TaxID=2921394 RepID=UPI0030F99325
MRILVIDDAYAMRNLIQRCVKQAGYNIPLEAKSSHEGIQILEAKKPDLVLLDLKLEGNDSFEFLEYIRTLSNPPVIFGLNGSNQPEISERAMEHGVKLVVRKPFQPRFLTDRIDELAEELAEKQTEIVSTETIDSTEKIKEPQLFAAEVPLVQDDAEDDFFNQKVTVMASPKEEPDSIIRVKSDRDQLVFERDYEQMPISKELELLPVNELVPESEVDVAQVVNFFHEEAVEILEDPVLKPEVWRPRIRPPNNSSLEESPTLTPSSLNPEYTEEVYFINKEEDAQETKESFFSLIKKFFNRKQEEIK